ncbi:MAG: hypothetical protein ACU836_18485 [Gammaproteobacteria bacterium]
MPESQQGGESAALAAQKREPGLLSRAFKRAAGKGLASGPSRVLAA